MDDKTNTDNPKSLIIDDYKGEAPKLAAFKGALAYTAFVAPLMWVGAGVARLGLDKIIKKIPFGENAWGRMKQPFTFESGIIAAAFVAYDAYKDGKKSYDQAEAARRQYEKMALEHHIFREQLIEAGQKPKDLTYARTINLNDVAISPAPSSAEQKEHDQLVADNIAMRQTLNETSQILRHVEGEVKQGHLADSRFTMKEAAPASHVARLEAEQAAHAVTDAAPQLR